MAGPDQLLISAWHLRGPSGGLAAPRHRAARNHGITLVRPINKKPRIAPGLSEARCLLQGGVGTAFCQISS
jgi:hypothetical protein